MDCYLVRQIKSWQEIPGQLGTELARKAAGAETAFSAGGFL